MEKRDGRKLKDESGVNKEIWIISIIMEVGIGLGQSVFMKFVKLIGYGVMK